MNKIYSWMLEKIRIPLPMQLVGRLVSDVADELNLTSTRTLDFGEIEPTLITMKNLPPLVDACNLGRWVDIDAQISADYLGGEMRKQIKEYAERDLPYRLQEFCAEKKVVAVAQHPVTLMPKENGHTYYVLRAFVIPRLSDWELPS